MTRTLHRATLARFAVRFSLGAGLTAGAVALALPGGAIPIALALGAGGLVALSGFGGKGKRQRATAPRKS